VARWRGGHVGAIEERGGLAGGASGFLTPCFRSATMPIVSGEDRTRTEVLLEAIQSQVKFIAGGHVAVVAHLGRIERKMDALDTRLGHVEGELTVVKVRVGKIEHHLGMNGASASRAVKAVPKKPTGRKPK
jgi:hypothetical protein